MPVGGVFVRDSSLKYIYIVDPISVFSICETNDTKRAATKDNSAKGSK